MPRRSQFLAVATSLVLTLSVLHGAEKPGISEDAGLLLDASAIDAGLVFIDGEFVPGPYRVDATAAGVTVNDRIVNSSMRELDEEEESDIEAARRRTGFRWIRADDREKGAEWTVWRTATMLRQFLSADSIVVAFSGFEMTIIQQPSKQCDLLKVLVAPNLSSKEFQRLLAERVSDAERGRWQEWLLGFSPPDQLRCLAEEKVAVIDDIEAANARASHAMLRVHAAAYPLTVFGMLLGAMAIGHLLRTAPKPESDRNVVPPETIQATCVSLAFIVVMAGCDLAWTILASEAGQMRELNPLGHQLIDDPQALIAFKCAATAVGCGVLGVLRRHSRAQLVSWWMCLVSALLTLRWVLFHSLFIA